jgi:hypothetical protein
MGTRRSSLTRQRCFRSFWPFDADQAQTHVPSQSQETVLHGPSVKQAGGASGNVPDTLHVFVADSLTVADTENVRLNIV